MTDEKKQTVLVAESSKTLSKLISKAFEQKGFLVKSCSDGYDALLYALEQNPDCIVADTVLSTVDGFMLCEVIKDGGGGKSIPVVLFSADENAADFWADTSSANAILTLSLETMESLVQTVSDLLCANEVDVDVFGEKITDDEKSEADGAKKAALGAILAMDKSNFFYNMFKAVFDLHKNAHNLELLVNDVFCLLYRVCEYDVAALILKGMSKGQPCSFYFTGLEKMSEAASHDFRKICRIDFEEMGSIPPGELYERHLIDSIVPNPKENAAFSSYKCFSIDADGFLGTLHVASTKKKFFSYKLASSVQFMTQHIGYVLSEAYTYKNKTISESKMRSAFSKFVPTEVIDDLLSSDNEMTGVQNERRNLAILICDIRNFTSISEINQPENVVGFLNRFFTLMVDVIKRHGGTIDKFMGDAIMALFGAPVSYVDNAERALSAALEMSSLFNDIPPLQLDFPKGIQFDFGIGIHYGEAIVGNIGCVEKTNYTVIGDSVNLASRLEGLTKQYGSRIIISESVKQELKGSYNLLDVDNVKVKGKEQSVKIFRADEKPLPPEYIKNYENGLNLYREGAWTLAADYFKKAQKHKADDKAVKLMIQRCKEFAANPPEHWEGAVALTSK